MYRLFALIFMISKLSGGEVEHNFAMAKAYLALKDPQKALHYLQDLQRDQLNPNEHLETVYELAEAYLALDQPLHALSLVQQMAAIPHLPPYQLSRVYALASKSFLELKDAKRSVVYAELSEDQRCLFDKIKGQSQCKKEDSRSEDESLFFRQKLATLDRVRTDDVFDRAIDLQKRAMELTIALPFIHSYDQDFGKDVLKAQKEVQQVRSSFVEHMKEKQKVLPATCTTEPYEDLTDEFNEGMNDALLAEKMLIEKHPTFVDVIPLQELALSKFQNAKEAFKSIHEMQQTPSGGGGGGGGGGVGGGESNDLKLLKKMLEDEKTAATKNIPKETNQIIW